MAVSFRSGSVMVVERMEMVETVRREKDARVSGR